jgi:Uma2 family endonuclease
MSLTSSFFHSTADVVIPAGRPEHEWPPQGKWTYEDYCRLPEDGWTYEVIEGELYMSPAPLTRHQRCKGNLFAAFWNFSGEHDVGMVLDAPTDVILSELATPVQPDIIFVVKERLDIVKDERVEGAPDIVVEVLSPGNWLLDRREKFKVYAKAGVREYWIIDPHARTIELFCLRGSAYELIGKYGVGETVRSEVLPGFEVNVEEVCPA